MGSSRLQSLTLVGWFEHLIGLSHRSILNPDALILSKDQGRVGRFSDSHITSQAFSLAPVAVEKVKVFCR